ncbi:MAG: hypothetical protein R2704_15630 [Microthrixaceae bacterium]
MEWSPLRQRRWLSSGQVVRSELERVVAAHLLIAWPFTRLIMRRSVPVAVLMSATGMVAVVVVALVVIRPHALPRAGPLNAIEDSG